MYINRIGFFNYLMAMLVLVLAQGCIDDESDVMGVDDSASLELQVPEPEEGVELVEAPEEIPSDIEEEDDPEFRYWTGYTSEEYPPLVCPNWYYVRGFHCTGRYCDNIRINCTYKGIAHGESSWTRFFSEENQHWEYCDWDQVMTGLNCDGSYCDNISMECTELPGKRRGSCSWSGWYSEEQGNYYAYYNRYVRGINCGGRYCDNKQYYSCTMYNK